MKRLLIITSAAALLLAGCAKNEVFDIPQEKSSPVGFATYVGKAPQTKGTSLTIDVLKEKKFGVYAFYVPGQVWKNYTDEQKATPNFMNNVEVYWDSNLPDEEENVQGDENLIQPDESDDPASDDPSSRENAIIKKLTTKWTYDNIKYWPVEKDEQGNTYNGPMTFFAYAPYTDDEEWKWEDAEGKLTFELAENVKDLKDFVYSSYASHVIRDSDMTLDGQEGEQNTIISGLKIASTVSFNFRHALSRIGFSASVNAPGLEVAITKIEVGEKAQAVKSPETGETNRGFYDKADFKLGKALFGTDMAEEMVSYTRAPIEQVAANYWDITGSTPNATFILTEEDDNFKDDVFPLTSTMTLINADDSYLFVIPQNFTGENALPISVEYTVKSATEENAEVATYTMSGHVIHDFQQGVAYQIQIELDRMDDGLNPVKFAVYDDFDWDEASENPTVGDVLTLLP